MRKKIYLVALFLILVIASAFANTVDVTAADVSYKYSADDSGNTYGYDYFGTMSNKDGLQGMYKEMDDIVKAFHADSSKNADSSNIFALINYEKYGLTLDEALSVWQIYKFDNPLYYWISMGVDYTGDSLKLKVVPEYRYGVNRVKQNGIIESKIQSYLNLVSGETDPYAISWILQKEICLSAEYKRDKYNNPSMEEYCHNIDGILCGKGTVCEGYTKLFSLLLNECGIDNVIVIGEAGDEAHSWNMVKMSNGSWYYCDLTWDDNSMMLYDLGSFDRFMKGSTVFSDHTLYTENGTGLQFLYKIPVAQAGNYSPIKLGKNFRVGKDRYFISGYKEVTLYKTTRTGNVTIPETVKYNGVTYNVVALGKNEYFDTLKYGKVKSIVIPKTVRMIWDYVLTGPEIKSISVNPANKYYRSKNGILYTKSYFTLVQYPSAKKMTRLTLPKNTHFICNNAICTKEIGGIGELVINANVELVGATNWGSGHVDKRPSVIDCVQGNWGTIASSCKKITISKANKTFYIKNNCIIFKSEVWYGDNGEYVYGEVVAAPASCNVKRVTIPRNAVAIATNAFYRLPRLQTVKFNKKLKVIEQSAFDNDAKLNNVVLPENLVYMGEFAFANCSNDPSKTFKVYIPKSVKEINGTLGCENVVIHGVRNSYARKYAKVYGYKFTTKKLR